MISEPLHSAPPDDLGSALLPQWLAGLHRSLAPGDRCVITLTAGHVDGLPISTAALLDGAGFASDEAGRPPGDGPGEYGTERLRSLPDWVGPGMRALVIGLNPSPASADAGVSFARPGNRFWPAALAAGLVTVDRDPETALRADGVGFTDLVKRTTAKASELDASEYGDGMRRLTALVTWLRPDVCLIVGLAGWRAAVERKATAGWQDGRVGTSPVYLMPNTSGLNASSSLADFTDHFRTALLGPDGG